MANEHETLESLFDDIADEIREKTGDPALIVADNFPEAIRAIPGGNLSPTSIANTFSTEQDYSIGDPVMYDGQLYVFIANHTAGAWNSAEVEAHQLAEDTSALKSAFSLFDDVPGSTQTVNFGSDGKPSSIVYTVNGVAARTDTFVWGTGTVTETRTLADGRHITFATNLTTLVTTISDIEEAS